jgi:hypothetical protein
MKRNDLIRAVIVLATLGYLFSGDGGGRPSPKPPPPVVEPYTGSLTALHQAARQMTPEDRQSMSAGFSLGADQIDADKRGLIDKTDVAQTFLLALLTFDYNGVGKPAQKYPTVADEVEKVFTNTLGDEIKPMNSSDRSRLASSLREMSKAIQ